MRNSIIKRRTRTIIRSTERNISSFFFININKRRRERRKRKERKPS
jgi:hypothetical protein